MKNLLILIIAPFVCSCKTPDKKLDEKQLNAFVSAQLTDKAGKLSLVNFKEFDWDKLYVQPPYSKIDEKDELLSSVALNDFPETLTLDDGVCVLIFFNKTKFVGHMEVSRQIDFSPLGAVPNSNNGKGYDRPDCVFKYREVFKGERGAAPGAWYKLERL